MRDPVSRGYRPAPRGGQGQAANEVSNRATRYINLAIRESGRSTYNRVKIGAVVVRGNTVLGKGANLSSSHPIQFFHNTRVRRVAPAHALHAELHAIIKCRYHALSNAEIFIGRLDRQGNLAMCRPCSACLSGLQDVGITKITYTTPNGIVTENIK